MVYTYTISSHIIFSHNMKIEHSATLVFQKHMEYTKINSFSVNWQWTIRKWNKNIIYNNIPNHQICRNNLMKDIQDLYTLTIKHCWEELKKIYINGNIYHSHGLEVSILLRFVDSMWSHSKPLQAFPLWKVMRWF